jgi:hypothetical protein
LVVGGACLTLQAKGKGKGRGKATTKKKMSRDASSSTSRAAAGQFGVLFPQAGWQIARACVIPLERNGRRPLTGPAEPLLRRALAIQQKVAKPDFRLTVAIMDTPGTLIEGARRFEFRPKGTWSQR